VQHPSIVSNIQDFSDLRNIDYSFGKFDFHFVKKNRFVIQSNSATECAESSFFRIERSQEINGKINNKPFLAWPSFSILNIFVLH